MSGQPNQGKFVKVKVNLNAPKKETPKTFKRPLRR